MGSPEDHSTPNVSTKKIFPPHHASPPSTISVYTLHKQGVLTILVTILDDSPSHWLEKTVKIRLKGTVQRDGSG
jgi:hypothetical protein